MLKSVRTGLVACAVMIILGIARGFHGTSLRFINRVSGNSAFSSSRLQYKDSRAAATEIGVSNSNKIISTSSMKSNFVKIGSVATPTKVGVLLLNLGGPETMGDVEGFLYNLFADPDIIRLPSFLSFMQKPIAYVIAKRRAPKSSAAYLSIGGGSPIVKYTAEQASLIQASLRQKGLKDAQCYFAMRYWNPYTEEVLEQMHKDGVNSMVILPLYPQYSISTSGASNVAHLQFHPTAQKKREQYKP